MKKLLFLGVIFAMILFAGCGSSKNEDADADMVDTEMPDTTPDDDPEEPPSGGGGSCNGKKSFGSTSFTRDESNVFDDCLRELKYSNDSYCHFDPDILLAKLQKTTIVFEKKCKQNNEPVQCPDFIPDSITLSRIRGCNIYYVYGEVDCYAECPDLYFSTDNEIFKVVSFHPYEGYISASTSDLAYAYLSSVNAEKGLSFSIDTGEDSIASFKSSDSSITLSFELWVDGILEEMPHCEDSEGRKYKAGEKISQECYMMECHYSQWYKSGGGGGYQCESCAVGLQRQWLCADGVSRVDWCECVKDSESQFGSRYSCIERADLSCPEE